MDPAPPVTGTFIVRMDARRLDVGLSYDARGRAVQRRTGALHAKRARAPPFEVDRSRALDFTAETDPPVLGRSAAAAAAVAPPVVDARNVRARFRPAAARVVKA